MPPKIAGDMCGLDTTLWLIAGKWKPLILYFLSSGTTRYGELKRVITGVSDKVLIQQLKELVADEVVIRTDYQQVPPKVDYSLTPLGRSLADALAPLCVWGSLHKPQIVANRAARGLCEAPGRIPAP